MSAVDPITSALGVIEDEMRRIVRGDAEPYECGLKIWQTAMSITTSPELMHPLWLIWGALTDWIETRPEERATAEAAMLRACREWLALPSSDPGCRAAYLERWIYDEMGYERKSAP